MRRIAAAVTAALLGVTVLAGCTANQPSSVQKDQALTNQNLNRLQANQPAPAADRSQYRQTVIDVENAQIHGVATTTFFFNQGVTRPIKVCSSIGFPVASTSQLTNPEQLIGGSANGTTISGTVGQQEPNGVYTGDSSGTYVICVAPNGTKYVTYWEGFVHTEGGAAHWDNNQAMIILDGPPTVVANDPKCHDNGTCK